MKRNLLLALMMLSFPGAVFAQGQGDLVTALNNIDGAANNLVANSQATGTTLLDGQVEATAENLNTTATGLGADLAAGTDVEPLADVGVQLGNSLVDAGRPLFMVLEDPASQLAMAGAPLTDPLAATIDSVEFELSLSFVAPGLSAGNAGLTTSLDLGALTVADLPPALQELNPSTVTSLLEGDSLSGLPAN